MEHVPDLPPIHVEMTESWHKAGMVPDENNYRLAWAHCQEIPNITKKSLDSGVVVKLGRTYYQLWYAGQRMAVRTDHWTFKEDSLCVFSPVHESSLAIVGAEGAQLIDLVAHTRHFDPNIRLKPATATIPNGDDDALRAQVQAQLEQHGQGGLIPRNQGDGTEAGQPCRRLRNERGESCLWSGGDRWGFGTSAGIGVVSWSAYELALRMEPAGHGDGRYLSTQRMTVGQALDENVFARPSGLAEE